MGSLLKELAGLAQLLLYLAQLGQLILSQFHIHVAFHVFDEVPGTRHPAPGGTRHLRQAFWPNHDQGDDADQEQLGKCDIKHG